MTTDPPALEIARLVLAVLAIVTLIFGFRQFLIEQQNAQRGTGEKEFVLKFQSSEPRPAPRNEWLNQPPPPPAPKQPTRPADRYFNRDQVTAKRATESDPDLEQLLQLIEASLLTPFEKEAAIREARKQHRSKYA